MKPFHFKQFAIRQTSAAMKVGTDAMLLGSLCDFPKGGRLLDIGTGTGVLALMLAQRFQPEHITAVEFDAAAQEDAAYNFSQQPFETTIELVRADIREFQTEIRFDGIISNPPFFENSSLSTISERNRARHTHELSFEELFAAASRLLSDNGIFWLIFPFEHTQRICSIAGKMAFFPHIQITVEGKPGKAVRSIVAFSRTKQEIEEQAFTVRNTDGSYSDAYIELTVDFHGTDLRK